MTHSKQSKDTDAASAKQREEQHDDTLAKLITLAGPRPGIPIDTQHRVYATVRNEWSRATTAPRVVRWAAPLALAASILIAVTIMLQPPELQVRSVGTIAKVSGVATDAGFIPGNSVNVGDVLDTPAGQGISIELRHNVSLRVGASSMLRIDGLDEFTLLAGQVYVDSGEHIYRRQHVTIHTENGSATDIGTQFSVRYDGTDMSVAVREGRVDVKDSLNAYTAQAGQQLNLRSGEVARIEDMAVDGSQWDWAISLSPAYDLESGSLMDFLQWVSRETGKELVFASNEVSMAAMRSRLHGSVDRLTPIEALATVQKISKFNIRFDDRYIRISQ